MDQFLICAFWGATSITLYTYVGYPLWIHLQSRLWPHPWRQAPIKPTVSAILVVHNGAVLLSQRIDQLLSLDYPRAQIEFIVVSDGSTDETNRILTGYPVIKPIILLKRHGKATALNVAMRKAKGEILVFLDIRPQIESSALQILLSNFADPKVGCATGEVILRDDGHDQVTKAVGSLYWRYEQWIRKCESKIDSPIGVYGGFYAVRQKLACALPEVTVLDDMLQPLNVIRRGFRSVVDARVHVQDVWPKRMQGEFDRKVRTLAGNFQLLQLAPWLLSRENRLRFEFISHKLLRLVVPPLLIVLFVTSAMLASRSRFYEAVLAVQLILYIFAFLGEWRGLGFLVRISGAARAFLMMNAAVIVGFFKFLFTEGPLWEIWTPTAPLSDEPSGGNIDAALDDVGVNLAVEPVSSKQTD
jgi:cellulose synthase/poly-beta-1,6-N-acetylglucosamine synthase-like glycosyltransferase